MELQARAGERGEDSGEVKALRVFRVEWMLQQGTAAGSGAGLVGVSWGRRRPGRVFRVPRVVPAQAA